MKTATKIFLILGASIPAWLGDLAARETRESSENQKIQRPAAKPQARPAPKPKVQAAPRPSVRPAPAGSRNPITQSKLPPKPSTQLSRPAPKPVERPSAKPAVPARPITKPAVPKPPATKPAIPAKPAVPPATKPAIPGKPAVPPTTKPAIPGKPAVPPTTKPAIPGKPAVPPGTKPAIPGKPSVPPGTKPPIPGKPAVPPGTKPAIPKPPGTKPAIPGKPAVPPGTKPAVPSRPPQRPTTKPGNVTYPKPPVTRPPTPSRPGATQKPVTRPGVNTRPIQKPNLNRPQVAAPGKPTTKPWWDSGRPGANRPGTAVNRPNVGSNNTWGNQVNSGNTQITINQNNIHNTHINKNFQNNINWSTNRKNWGYNPWWNRPATRPWYGGSWNCGWNNTYYRRHRVYHHHHYYGGYRPLPGYVVYESSHNDVASAIGWGLVGWSLGKLIFDSGYQSYSNPYPAQPVPTSRGESITYNQPITVVAAKTAPTQEEEAAKLTELSESHIAESQTAFKQGDYLRALDFANKAVAEAPGDGALHEYRALVLFALGKFSEAAGVLNPVLAGGPGWDWTTMISLYSSQQAYMDQLARLQAYSASKPDAADARFLLGYHYMVCGHLEQAAGEFEQAATLQPADTVSAQLRDLTRSSSNNGDAQPEAGPEADPEADPSVTEDPEAAQPPPPIPLENLTGTWTSDKGDQGTVTLAFKDDGSFIWTFQKQDVTNDFSGEFSMNDNGLLVLDAEESQMVAAVELPEQNQLKFVLAGGPPGDPGLTFVRK